MFRSFSVTSTLLLLFVHPVSSWVLYGNDPFHQPNATTLYWGSGDVDGDKSVTEKDLLLAQKMVAGELESVCMADVNGDGIINTGDITVLNQFLQKSIDHLPSWWNSMTTRDERKAWLQKAIAFDKTDTLPYDYVYTCWFVCKQFSEQTALRLSGVRGTLNDNLLEAGQFGWNIPVYRVALTPLSGAGHAINAVLLGDNPLNFNDWYFFEPQTDSMVTPGAWDMMPGEIHIEANIPNGTRCAQMTYLTFNLKTDLSITLDSSSVLSFLTKQRISVAPVIDNSISEWRFRCISAQGTDNIICNRVRNDLSGNNDLYIGDYNSTKNGYFPTDNRCSYMLDACKGKGSTVYLLWREKNTANKPSLFIGTYDMSQKKFLSKVEISNKGGYWYEGKLLFKDENHILAFWTENFGSFGADPMGIYCAMYNGSTAAPYQMVFPFDKEYDGDISPCFFDVVNMNNDTTLFLTRNGQGTLYQKLYSFVNNKWSDSSIVSEKENIQDIDLVKDAKGNIQLFYTSIDNKTIPGRIDSLGNKEISYISGYYGTIKERSFVNNRWSAPVPVSTRESTSSPYAISSADGSIYLACVNSTGKDYNVIVNQYKNNEWKEIKNVTAGIDYQPKWPRLHISSDNKLNLLWKTNFNDQISINRELVTSDLVYEGIKIKNKPAELQLTWKIMHHQIAVTPEVKSGGMTTITISDLLGRILFTKIYNNIGQTEYINTDKFGRNSLIFMVKNGSTVFTHKFIPGSI